MAFRVRKCYETVLGEVRLSTAENIYRLQIDAITFGL